MSNVALVKIQLVVHPIGREPIGLRLKAAEYNVGPLGPSFSSPYFITEGSDRTTMYVHHLEAFERWLEAKGWRVSRHGKLIDRLLAADPNAGLDMHTAYKDKKVSSEQLDRFLATWETLTLEQQLALLKQV